MTGALFVAKPASSARGGAPKGKAKGAWKHGLYSERAKAKRLLVKAASEGHLKPSEDPHDFRPHRLEERLGLHR